MLVIAGLLGRKRSIDTTKFSLLYLENYGYFRFSQNGTTCHYMSRTRKKGFPPRPRYIKRDLIFTTGKFYYLNLH